MICLVQKNLNNSVNQVYQLNRLFKVAGSTFHIRKIHFVEKVEPIIKRFPEFPIHNIGIRDFEC